MMANGEAFIKWALAAERTVEERFSVLVLVERLARDAHSWGWAARQAEWKARRYNPAWVPVLDAAEVRVAAGKLEAVGAWHAQNHDDRAVRSLEVVRFLPNLRELLSIPGVTDLEPLRHVPDLVTLSVIGEVMDLSPLRYLQKLTTLSVGGTLLEDYRPVALCRKLRTVTMHCAFPWPRMEGWEALEELEELSCTGSALGFLGMKCLPAVRRLHVSCGTLHGTAGCMRDLGQLPEMPELRELWALHFFSLNGIERYPKLQAALVGGHFRTAAPAAALPVLTHLRLWSNELREVKSLTAAPALHQLVVHGQRPLDFSVLADAPQLREVLVHGCETPQVDVDMLRMVLPGWEGYFAAPEPRALNELKRVLPEGEQRVPDWPQLVWPVTGEPWEMNRCFQESAVRWANQRLREALDARGMTWEMGFHRGTSDRKRRVDNGYALMQVPTDGRRSIAVNVLGPRALSQFRELVLCLRELLATFSHPWGVMITGTPAPDDDDWGREWTPEDREEMEAQDDKDREERRLREQELLAQELRVSLLTDEGIAPDPKDFGITAPPPGKNPGKGGTTTLTKEEPEDDDDSGADIPFEEPNLDWNNRDEDDDSEGGLKDADPEDEDEDEHWLTPPPDMDPNTFWSGLNLYLYLTEEALYIPDKCSDVVEYLLKGEA